MNPQPLIFQFNTQSSRPELQTMFMRILQQPNAIIRLFWHSVSIWVFILKRLLFNTAWIRNTGFLERIIASSHGTFKSTHISRKMHLSEIHQECRHLFVSVNVNLIAELLNVSFPRTGPWRQQWIMRLENAHSTVI